MIGILRAQEPQLLYMPPSYPDQLPGRQGRDNAGSNSKAAAKPGPKLKAKKPSMEQQISFVSFDQGISQENRKAVRVQAAKASAAARKATIAKKLALQKKESGHVEADGIPAPASVAASSAERRVKRKRTSPEPPRIERPALVQRTSRPAVLDFQSGYFPVNAYHQQGSIEVADEEIVRQPQHEPFGGMGVITPASLRSRSPQPTWKHATGASVQMPLTPDSTGYGLLPSPALEDDNEEGDADFQSVTGLPSPGRVGLDMADPFSCYPVQRHPIYDRLLHHMLTIFAPRGWPALKISRPQGMDWERFMTQHALAEPALFHVRLLFASGDMITLGALKPEVSYWLRSEAIRCINEALHSKDRAASDGLILAVGRIALHESMYGNRDASTHIHRPAQRRMIDMRGGMKALEFPALVKRLMRWSDRVMSMQSGSERFLPDEEDQGNETFTVKQSVNVLESWVPQEGQALRKRIAISDLLSE